LEENGEMLIERSAVFGEDFNYRYQLTRRLRPSRSGLSDRGRLWPALNTGRHIQNFKCFSPI